MRFITLAAIVAALSLITGCQKKPVDNDFASPDGLFRVYMPGRPQTEKQNFAGGPSTLYTVDHLNRVYAVGVSEVALPENESEEGLQSRIKDLTEEQIALIRGRLTGSKWITLGRYPGLEVQAQLPDDDGILRAKTFIANNRLYRVLCVAADEAAFKGEGERFLSSFQIVAPATQ